MQDFYRILPQRFVPCKKHAKSSYFRDYREMFNWFIPFELWGRITEHIKSETWKVLAWRSWLKPARDRWKFRPQVFLDSQWELIQREILQTSLNFAKPLIHNWTIWKDSPRGCRESKWQREGEAQGRFEQWGGFTNPVAFNWCHLFPERNTEHGNHPKLTDILFPSYLELEKSLTYYRGGCPF